MLVKRLVCIEDLGDIDVLFTDKTGTLAEGSLRFMRSAGPGGVAGDEPLLPGLLCNEAVVEDGRAVGGNPLDVALWESPAAAGQQPALARCRFYRRYQAPAAPAPRHRTPGHRVRRRAARFTTRTLRPRSSGR